jgi:methylase of polypeptide subunit release factors
VKKLLHRGQGWLSAHPARELIVSRYLKHRTGLARLTEEDMVQADLASSEHDVEEAVMEKAISLHEQRLGAAVAVLKNSGAKRGVDLGCGEGKLLTLLLREPQFSHILRMDVSSKALEFAAERLHLDRLPAKQRERVELIQGSLMYRDPALMALMRRWSR